MKIELTTLVMIQNPVTKEVLIQNRTKKWTGWNFPGGKVERGESFYDCAKREVKEETGLAIENLCYCGVVHWCEKNSDDRYLVFLYKTTEFSGELITNSHEGQHFWIGIDALLSAPLEKFSNEYKRFYPLFFENKYSEAFAPWSEKKEYWEVYLK